VVLVGGQGDDGGEEGVGAGVDEGRQHRALLDQPRRLKRMSVRPRSR
jgi:hypothetical protein